MRCGWQTILSPLGAASVISSYMAFSNQPSTGGFNCAALRIDSAGTAPKLLIMGT